MEPDQTSGAMRMPRPWRMLWVTFAWGTCFVTISLGLRDASPLWLAALRASIAGVVLAIVVAGSRAPPPRDRRTWSLIACLGLVNVGLAYALMVWASAGVASGVASVLANAQPLLILLPAWWIFHERPSPKTIAATGLGMAGLLMIAIPTGLGGGAGQALLSAAAVAAGTLISRVVRAEPLVAGAGQLLIGGAVLAAAALLLEGEAAIEWSAPFTLVVLFMAVVGTAAPAVVWFAEARRSRLDVLAAWTLLVPVFGMALSLVILEERPDAWGWTGLGAVMAAMAILAAGPAPRGVRRGAEHSA